MTNKFKKRSYYCVWLVSTILKQLYLVCELSAKKILKRKTQTVWPNLKQQITVMMIFCRGYYGETRFSIMQTVREVVTWGKSACCMKVVKVKMNICDDIIRAWKHSTVIRLAQFTVIKLKVPFRLIMFLKISIFSFKNHESF